MQQEKPAPLLTEVICKIKLQEPLTADEEVIYLIYIEGFSEEEAALLVRKWYDLDGSEGLRS